MTEPPQTEAIERGEGSDGPPHLKVFINVRGKDVMKPEAQRASKRSSFAHPHRLVRRSMVRG